MTCHNASVENDYAGIGIENPHPFPGADNLLCTTCHGGNGGGDDRVSSHVPPPPEIGDEAFQTVNRKAYFNRLTLTGIDKFPDYQVNGKMYAALDFLQFINPGDLRVVTDGRACGQCHSGHAECVAGSLLATEAGILSGAMFAAGVDGEVPESQGLYEDTAADLGFRAVQNDVYSVATAEMGEVGRLLEFPVFSVFGQTGGDNMHNNPAYSAAGMSDDILPDGRLVTGSPLANVYHEQIAFTCGDCHLGSAGANNRYGDFRSSGCTACHMQYSRDGRSYISDPNIVKNEPLDPDDIDEPERAHVERHLIRSIAKTLPSGEQVQGINDYACAGCHQGSNRTVMQYWGIRLDQNQDVRHNEQYPANPVSYQSTSGDPRLFDPLVNNNTFNGRNRNQYLRFEDYDGDGRDDTPADVHYEAGLGCIDCHGSADLHGGYVDGGATMKISSRQEQGVKIRCESCHGAADTYAPTQPGLDYNDQTVDLAMDAGGNPLRHVVKEADGNYYLYSRLTGVKHYIKQTKDTVVDNGQTHPFDGSAVYTALASYAMGRIDGNPSTGIGPEQDGGGYAGFSHGDNMSCVSCHASWTNSCIGCHLVGEYSTNNNNFSNITGDRIVFREDEAQFVYQSPVPFQLGVDTKGKIAPIAANTATFFQYEDNQNLRSQIFAFSDRNGAGANQLTTAKPALSHNTMMPHSIRGKVTSQNEGPRYCVACHLTEDGLANFGTEYNALRAALADPNFTGLDVPMFQLLQTHIGRNPGNQLDSPLWVHMVAGLGTGLFLFDAEGCAVNPLDTEINRYGCNGVAPASNFDLNRVVYNLDRIVEPSGITNGSNNHPMADPAALPNLREGALDPMLSGPLGWLMIQKLTDPAVGVVLDSWVDADGMPHGGAAGYLGP